MAYIAPHKRLSKNQEGPPPKPVLPNFNKSLDLNSSRSSFDKRRDKSTSYAKNIVYASQSISRWLAIPSVDNVQLSSSLSWAPVNLESTEFKPGHNLFTLVNEDLDTKSLHLEHTWESVAETLHADLLSAFQNTRNELVDQNLEKSKIGIIARFGKVLFRRNPSFNQDLVKENSVSESYIKQLKRIFYTNVSAEYMKYVKETVVPELGVHFNEEKDMYHVKLADAKRPNLIISCKCRVQKDEKKLEPYKIELNPVRHLVVDMSCLASNVDLRLALCTTKILTALQEEEMQDIRNLISSAIFDPNVKGGLRWSLGKSKYGGQYSVVNVWHTKTEIYCNSSIRLKVREADRFDFLNSSGEVTTEVALKLTGITKNLLEQGSEATDVLPMIDNALRLIQNHFLAWDGSLVSFSAS